MTTVETILILIGSNVAIGYLVKLILETRLKEAVKNEFDREMHKFQQRWEIKREACLSAMEVVDAIFSHANWSNIPKTEKRVVQEISTKKGREVWNRLAAACDNHAVLDAYSECVNEKNINPAALNKLRLAIRQELGLRQIPLDDKACFILALNNDPEITSLQEIEENKQLEGPDK